MTDTIFQWKLMELLQTNILISLHFLKEIELYFSGVILCLVSLLVVYKSSVHASWCLKLKRGENSPEEEKLSVSISWRGNERDSRLKYN